MNQPSIFLTTKDVEKLRDLIREAYHTEYRGSEYLKKLAAEIEKASVVLPDQIPSDVITLHSTARLLDQETSEEMIYTLVFPEDADVAQGKISILAPIGRGSLWERPGISSGSRSAPSTAVAISCTSKPFGRGA